MASVSYRDVDETRTLSNMIAVVIREAVWGDRADFESEIQWRRTAWQVHELEQLMAK